MKLQNILVNYWIYLFLFIIVHILFFKFEVFHNTQVKTLIEFYGSCAFILSVCSIYIQINNQYNNTLINEVNNFSNIIETINTSIYNCFSSKPEMKYYYDELYFNNSNYNEKNRNLYLEQLITNKILSNIDSFINFIIVFKNINNSDELLIVEKKLKNILTLFLKSKIFKQNWLYYKDNLALQITKDYIQNTFNQ
jgi:translation initiation factor 2 beta subunit (eIF-2beta)/eIF-5